MNKLNPSHIDHVIRVANGCPYFNHLAMHIVRLDSGIADVEMDLDRFHLQAFGYVHGGAIASLIDTAAFWSVYCDLREGHGITSVDINVTYLAACQAGKLLAKGRMMKLGAKLGYADASVVDQRGKLIAHGTSTIIVVPGMPLDRNPDLPPKFLA